MADTDRRGFLKQAAAGATVAGTAAAQLTTGAAVGAEGSSANKTLSVALVGCGGRGMYLAGVFSAVKDIKITHLCDVDEKRLANAAKAYRDAKPLADMRVMLDDKSLDAVIVATPDHWHSPASILACDAGKHVYVEKPCSHNIREGRLLVEAARRNKRVVQHGTQVRSTQMMIEAVKALREGVIGKVLVAKAWNIQRRGTIGHATPSAAPAGLNYEDWVGPAEMMPYQTNRVPGGWHWWYNFGTGDMGNDGIHDLEYARWGLGVDTHPRRVVAMGGKYFFDDDQQFPDTQQVSFEYPGDGQSQPTRMLIYEQRLWSSNYPRNVDSGAEFYGTSGQMFLSRRGKIQVIDNHNKPIETNIKPLEQDAPSHVANFVDSIRAGKTPSAEIELGHMTATLCHLGNLATRLGRTLQFNPETEQIVGDDEANRLVARDYRDHWGKPQGV